MSNISNPRKVFNLRETQSTAWLNVIFAGVASTSIVICCVGGCLLLFGLPQLLSGRLPVGISQFMNWDTLSAFTSLTTFALVIGGLVFAAIDYVQNYVQRMREASESSFNMYKEVYERLMNPNSIAARRWVIVNLPTLKQMQEKMKDEQEWFDCVRELIDTIPANSTTNRAPGKDYIKTILNDLDFIGFINENYWKMENELVKWMSSPVAKVWERIHLYVEKEGQEREEDDYYEAARKFAEQCVKWRADQNLKSNVITNGT